MTTTPRLRAAYVTEYDSDDVRAWSGTGRQIRDALAAAGLEINAVGSLARTARVASRLKGRLVSSFRSCAHATDREPSLLKRYARAVEAALARTPCDVVVSPGTLPIAHLRTTKSLVIWTDSVFAGMVDFYPEFTGLCATSLRNGHAMEQAALTRCQLALFSSDWAAATAVQHYDVDAAKVKVVPFGANIPAERTALDLEEDLPLRLGSPLALVFIGTHWERKGGDFAMEVARVLTARGIPTTLDLIGATPPSALPPFVRAHGLVSKSTGAGQHLFDCVMRRSSFLIAPSRAECCAVALAEASAYGMPSLSTAVGGNATALNDGRNGRLFPLSASPEAHADFVQQTIASRASYDTLARSSFAEYQNRLNWSTAGATAVRLIREIVA